MGTKLINQPQKSSQNLTNKRGPCPKLPLIRGIQLILPKTMKTTKKAFDTNFALQTHITQDNEKNKINQRFIFYRVALQNTCPF